MTRALPESLAALVEAGAAEAIASVATALSAVAETAFDAPPVPAEVDAVVELVRSGSVGPRAWADACHAALLGRGPGVGTHATPWRLADWLVVALAAPAEGRVLDPACGTGHLLVAEALRQPRPPESWLGVDICSGRAAATQVALWLAHERRGRPADYAGVRAADALLEDEPAGGAEGERAPGLVLANPPFASVRELARRLGPAYVARLRERYPRLRGSFDLYVPFLLRLATCAAAGARFGVILPATFWSAAYAAPARDALAAHVMAVHRVRGRDLFEGAAVTTHVLLGAASVAGRVALFETALDGVAAVSHPEGEVARELLARPGYPTPARQWSAAATVPLGDVAEVTAGTPGYHAAAIAAGLREATAEGDVEDVRPFVVTRSVEPYRLALGDVRFQRRRWRLPVLRLSVLTPGKRALFTRPKVVVAGVSRRLEAARDPEGVALGVGVYAVIPHGVATEIVLALLNSLTISDWYRHRFLGRELSGGYFAVNVAHLAAVPVPRAWVGEGAAAEVARVVQLVREREACVGGRSGEAAGIEAEIEACVGRALGIRVGGAET